MGIQKTTKIHTPQKAVESGNQESVKHVDTARRRRRPAWEIEMSVEAGNAAVSNHPLAGMNSAARTEARWRAIGQVLAAIATRKSGDDQDSSECFNTFDHSADKKYELREAIECS